MKIAIIADNLGNNAPGLVFRNILTGLSKKIEFDIITSTLDYRAPKEHGCPKAQQHHQRNIEEALTMYRRREFHHGG